MNAVFDAVSTIKLFYDLDNCDSANHYEKSSVYKFKKSTVDDQFLKVILNPFHAKENISKIKQISSLLGFYYHVSNLKTVDDSIKHSLVEITVHKENKINMSIGNGISLIFNPAIDSDNGIEYIVFGSRAYINGNTLIDDETFERVYSGVLDEISKYVDVTMTLSEFKKRDIKTLDEIRAEYLNNPDLIYINNAEIDLHFSKDQKPAEEFFKPLSKIFSNNLIKQVKMIESLLRFESHLKYGKVKYKMLLHYQLATLKFNFPTSLYGIVFKYDEDAFLENKLLLHYRENNMQYLSVNYDSGDSINITGYAAIYEHIFDNIRNLLTSKLNVTADEITNESVLLYQMISI